MSTFPKKHDVVTAAIRLIAILLFFLHVATSCNYLKEKKESLIGLFNKQQQESEVLADTTAVDDMIMMVHAFGELYFGMDQDEVNSLNEKRQRLGKHDYNFSYSFNSDGQLYSLTIFSDQTKALNYESGIEGRYYNLYDIITMKYGNPSGGKYVPSVFDVMNAGAIWINKWEANGKEIMLGVRDRKNDSFDVACRISELEMEQQEKDRLYRIRNKDKIDASDKF